MQASFGGLLCGGEIADGISQLLIGGGEFGGKAVFEVADFFERRTDGVSAVEKELKAHDLVAHHHRGLGYQTKDARRRGALKALKPLMKRKLLLASCPPLCISCEMGGKIRSGSAVIGGVTSTSIVQVIVARATALSLTKSEFLGKILAQWASDGFPPVSEPDKHMAPGVMAALVEKKPPGGAPGSEAIRALPHQKTKPQKAPNLHAFKKAINESYREDAELSLHPNMLLIPPKGKSKRGKK